MEPKINNFNLNNDKTIELKNKIIKKNDVNEYIYNKYDKESQKHWNIFYKRNKDKFFKDRHYLEKEINFKELLNKNNNKKINFLEIGCGVGNSIFPLLEKYKNQINFYCIDFSDYAINIIKSHPLYNEDYIKAEVCDLVKDNIPFKNIKFNLITSIFVISAIDPKEHIDIFKKLKSLMYNESIIYFRDYGLYDEAQIRLNNKEKNNKLKENFYLKDDRTKVYYFNINELKNIIQKCGLNCKKIEYITKIIENKKENNKMHRIWIQGFFN